MTEKRNKDWLLMGTGPSRGQFPLPHDDILVATVNAGWSLPRINAYGLFEVQASIAYQRHLKAIMHQGGIVFTRPRIQRRVGAQVMPIGADFGPSSLQYLHRDDQWAPEDGTPEWGQHISWISSGVLMLWIVAELYKPGTIYITGLDGYSAGDPNPVSKYERTAQWCEHMNAHMALGIERITKHYTDTDFVFLSKPSHWDDGWRATVADQAVLDDLYPEPNFRVEIPDADVE